MVGLVDLEGLLQSRWWWFCISKDISICFTDIGFRTQYAKDSIWWSRELAIRQWVFLRPYYPGKMSLPRQVLDSVYRCNICIFAIHFFFHLSHSLVIKLLDKTGQCGIKVWVIARVSITLLEYYFNIQYSIRKKLFDSW